jgi:hypothetical protein
LSKWRIKLFDLFYSLFYEVIVISWLWSRVWQFNPSWPDLFFYAFFLPIFFQHRVNWELSFMILLYFFYWIISVSWFKSWFLSFNIFIKFNFFPDNSSIFVSWNHKILMKSLFKISSWNCQRDIFKFRIPLFWRISSCFQSYCNWTLSHIAFESIIFIFIINNI